MVQRGNNMAIVPRFQVEVVHNRKIVQTVYTKVRIENDDADGKKRYVLTASEKEEIIPESFMVYFPGGHCTWFRDKAAMAQAGIIESANDQIDTETGLPVAPPVVVDLKSASERKLTQRRAIGG